MTGVPFKEYRGRYQHVPENGTRAAGPESRTVLASVRSEDILQRYYLAVVADNPDSTKVNGRDVMKDLLVQSQLCKMQFLHSFIQVYDKKYTVTIE